MAPRLKLLKWPGRPFELRVFRVQLKFVSVCLASQLNTRIMLHISLALFGGLSPAGVGADHFGVNAGHNRPIRRNSFKEVSI